MLTILRSLSSYSWPSVCCLLPLSVKSRSCIFIFYSSRYQGIETQTIREDRRRKPPGIVLELCSFPCYTIRSQWIVIEWSINREPWFPHTWFDSMSVFTLVWWSLELAWNSMSVILENLCLRHCEFACSHVCCSEPSEHLCRWAVAFIQSTTAWHSEMVLYPQTALCEALHSWLASLTECSWTSMKMNILSLWWLMLCKLASVHWKHVLVKNIRERQIDCKTDWSVLKCPY